jgi:large subunit ribosomal protein L18
MNHQKSKHIRQLRRRNHVRSGIMGTSERPRLTVFRSSKHIYAQLIDDQAGVTLASASSLAPDLRKGLSYGGNIKAAQVVGQKLAEAAKQHGIDKAAFDRGHYKFHGRVKALAEAANAAGLLCCEPKERKKVKLAAEQAAAAAAPPKAAEAPKEKKEKKEKKAPKEKKAE